MQVLVWKLRLDSAERRKLKKRTFKLTMFTSEMESMLAMLMLIPTMTGGPEGTNETLKSDTIKHTKS